MEEIVLNMNKIMYLSYQLLHYHFIKQLSSGREVPNPFEPNNKLLYRIFQIVSTFRNPTQKKMREREKDIGEFQDLFEDFQELKQGMSDDQLPFADYMGDLVSSFIIQQKTSIKNHLLKILFKIKE